MYFVKLVSPPVFIRLTAVSPWHNPQFGLFDWIVAQCLLHVWRIWYLFLNFRWTVVQSLHDIIYHVLRIVAWFETNFFLAPIFHPISQHIFFPTIFPPSVVSSSKSFRTCRGGAFPSTWMRKWQLAQWVRIHAGCYWCFFPLKLGKKML